VLEVGAIPAVARYDEMTAELTTVAALRGHVIDDICTGLGWSAGNRLRKLFLPLMWLPAHQFAKLCTWFDHEIEQRGISTAMQQLLPRFARSVEVRGAEQVPAAGPLLVVSNHPGTFDVVAISASLGRDDLQIVALGWPVLRHMPTFSRHLIFTSLDAHQRMGAVRSVIERLRAGDTVLIFPTADLDPDPDVLPGADAAFERWSPSLELFLRQVPETKVLPAVVSGVLSPKELRHPLARLPRTAKGQRTVAEMLQMGQQMFFPWSFDLAPRVTFGKALSVEELGASDTRLGIQRKIIEQARALLTTHMGRSPAATM
jgi:hypothetical protein